MRASAADLPVEVSKAITVQGARLAEAIMLGIKNIENRLFSMKPGWYALHVGRQLEHPDPSINIILDSCPEVAPALKLPVSAVVGIIHIEQHVSCRSVGSLRTQREKNLIRLGLAFYGRVRPISTGPVVPPPLKF